MTHADAVHTPTDPPPAPQKAVLVCSECGHRSPTDGDWLVRTVVDVDGGDCEDAANTPLTAKRRSVRECPDCETTIECRPQFDDRRRDRSRSAGSAYLSLVSRVSATWMRSLATIPRQLTRRARS